MTNVNTEVIPLLGEMSALADKRVPVFRRKSVVALYARLRGILLDFKLGVLNGTLIYYKVQDYRLNLKCNLCLYYKILQAL